MSYSEPLTDDVYDCQITIESDGWKGEPVYAGNGEENRFQFDIFGEVTGDNETYSCEPSEGNYGYVQNTSLYGAILGISLEHMGRANDSDTEPCFQFVGLSPYWQPCGAWGAKENDESLTVKCDNIVISSLELNVDGEPTTYTNHSLGRYFQYRNNVGIIFWRCQYVFSGRGTWRATIKTDLPIFATDADLLEYCQSNGTYTEKILNKAEDDPEEDYEKARRYRYAWNIYGHNAKNASQYTGYRNYRFYGGDGKICFYRVKPTASSPYTVKLYHYQSYVVKAAGVHDTDDEDFTTITNPELYFLHTSIQFSDNDYYTKFKFLTDLLVFGSESLAQQWVDDLIDARSAENFNEVSRAYDSIIDPGYGNPETGNDNGVNGQSYVHGARLWVMSSTELNHFFDDIFDPVHINDILNGTKLLGDGIQAIQGISYFPIDIDDVATVYSASQAIKIGSYECPTATGRYVQNNNKMIDCGSVFIAPVYNDFRDYKIKLFISLPYCGVHELEMSKFINHNLQVRYAVDITTGGCTAYVLADGISYGDTFDGFMASQRPLTALDQTAYLNSVMGCVSSLVGREAGMISTAKNAIAGVATGSYGETNGGGVNVGGGGGFSGLATSYGSITDLYGLSQAVKSQPMVTRGGFAGCLGFFGNQQIHIITIQSKTVKPSLEQMLVGYPSHVSQNVGAFSGYLKCSYFKMAAGFNGTLGEWNEINEIMAGGIYL